MANVSLSYGHGTVSVSIPETLSLAFIEPIDIPQTELAGQIVRRALDHPVDSVGLEKFDGARSAAVAINDKTRMVPFGDILPPLIERLRAVGIPSRAIRLIVATGTHVPMDPAEIAKMLPAEIISQVQIESHHCDDPSGLVFLGASPSNTPVWVNRHFYEADLKIVTGNIEPHHFMGFSGGAKSASIGLAGRTTINANHSMLLNPACCAGSYESNPMRMDVEDIGEKIGIHFALNAVLNGKKQIIAAFSGSPKQVMIEGIKHIRKYCQVPVFSKYDIVLASANGYPKDISLYQAQKALTHAAMITRDGGTVILAAECIEGLGSRAFEEFIQDVETPDQVIEKFSRLGFQIGPHKAFQLARDARRLKIYLVSGIPDDMVRKCMLIPASSVQEAFDCAMMNHPAQSPFVAVLPRATNTIVDLDPSVGEHLEASHPLV